MLRAVPNRDGRSSILPPPVHREGFRESPTRACELGIQNCVFRSMALSHSGPCRSLIPGMALTCSGHAAQGVPEG